MGITIERIDNDEHFEYKGDVRVTGSIGQNATVIIQDGNLIVDGDVEANAEITMAQETTTVITGSVYMSNVSIGNSGKSLNVQGNVENGVTISSKSADFNINGNVGEGCKFTTQSGDIKAGNVGDGSTFKTMSGDIKVANVGGNCTLKTMSGDVKAAVVGSRSSLKTMSGDVKVQSADRSVALETMRGDIYENGVKRKKDKAHGQTSVSIGGMSFIGGGRIFVNGRDVTELVNNASGNSNDAKAPQQEPVRYTKSFR